MTACGNRARRAHRDERGIALVESLVASTILGLAMVVLVGSYSTLAIASRKAQLVAEAQALARTDAASLKATAYQAGGDYSTVLALNNLPSGISRVSPTVAWWNGSSSWTSTQNTNGLEKVTLSYTGGGTTLATLDVVKGNR
jgi:hypothetical protein